MKNTLLGIKIISWLYIVGGVISSITAIFADERFFRGINILVSFFVGINLLKRKEMVRKFAIFLSSLTIIILLAGMIVMPSLGMQKEVENQENQNRYKQQSNYLRQIENKKGYEDEINTVKGEIALSKLLLDRHAEFDKKWKTISEHFQLNIVTIAGFCFQLFIIYYLTREYVIDQFKNNHSGSIPISH